MKILDRYLIKHFLIPTIFCTLTLIFLVLVADIFDNLDEFIRNGVTVRQALRYYLNLIPYIYVQIIQWSSFLGILYLLTTFNFHNELTAMKVCGLEATMIVRPLVFSGFLIGIFTFLVSDQLVPPTYGIAKRIQEERIERKKDKKDRSVYHDITYYGSGNRLYYAETLDMEKKKMKDFIILWLDSSKRTRKKVMAREAVWTGDAWELKHVNEFEVSSTGRLVDQPAAFENKIFPEITETPEQFYKSAAETTLIPYRELKEYLMSLKENGLRPNLELVDLYTRLASPWNTLIVMFITFPLLAKTATRKVMAMNILACIAMVFVFHVSTAVFVALGKSGKIYPLLSAWLSNFLFGFGALFFIDQANQ
ncbi:MAG: LptF/LptG family permease [Candidatus Omnitrophica bacterium]|nr:LptF/LptG family permease [Candidatus Omnitrophota bacterium]